MALRFQPQVKLPPAYLIDRFLAPMRATLGVWVTLGRVIDVEVTSWWREPIANAGAGGADYSQHIVGCAIDAVSPGRTRAQLLPLVQKVAARYFASPSTAVPSSASETSGRSVHVQGLPVGMVQTLLQRREPAILSVASQFVGPPRPLAAPALPQWPVFVGPPRPTTPAGRAPGGGFNL